jgi:selenocysteine lyase/cysteine desulfurase
VTGVVQPVEQYGEITRNHDIYFMVDAAQTAGRYPIDIQASNIDLLALSGHKGLFGPPGTGALFISGRTSLDTLFEGSTGTYSEQEAQPDALPGRYECGTLNSVGISGLGAGLKYISNEGLDKIRAHESHLTEELVKGLSHIKGLKLYEPNGISNRISIISMNIEGYEPVDIGAILDQVFEIKVRIGLHCAAATHKTLGTFPTGTVRLSLGYLNSPEDIEATTQALEQISSKSWL